MKGLLDTLLRLIYPPRCSFCKEVIGKDFKYLLCNSCLGKIKFIGRNGCTNCGKALVCGYEELCADCRSMHHHFDRAYSVAQYGDALKNALIRYKFFGKIELAKTFVELMADKVENIEDIDVVLSVPLHERRLKERGFNQSDNLAKSLAVRIDKDFADKCLIRIKNTCSQSSLPRIKRLINLKGAFRVADNKCIDNKRVLLVDDIYTTGSTVSECAKTLKSAGAKKVYVLTVASGRGY